MVIFVFQEERSMNVAASSVLTLYLSAAFFRTILLFFCCVGHLYW